MTSDAGGEPVAKTSESKTDNGRHEYEGSHKSRFRFKSKRRSREDDDGHRSFSHRTHRDGERRHRHHHRSKRHKRSPSPTQAKDDPSLYDDTHLPNASSEQYLDPDTAFRESLFDAMADDEGAQFWEGVYGQPIHQYPDVKEGPTGELERMTDEEYAAFVRGKMYEKTHQHLVEEKARRDAAKIERDRLVKEGRKMEEEARRFRSKVEESLRKGEERKKRKVWGEVWERYTKKWDELGKGGDTKVAIASIPWPVESGRKKDVDLQEIERFFLHAPTYGQPMAAEMGKVLKQERIRWHPDKIQQKLGGQDVSEDVIEAVTMVFQFIDQMWSEMRDSKK